MADDKTGKKWSKSVEDKHVVEIYDIGGLKVEGVSKDPNDWKVMEDDAYKPNKAAYVLKEFQEIFGAARFKEAQECYDLASRNKMVGDVLSEVNARYALVEKAPTYFRDVVSPEEFTEISNNLTNVRMLDRNEATELKELSSKYKQDCINVSAKYERLREPKIKGVNMEILMLKSNELPLTLSMAINSYTPAEDGTLPSSKSFGSEVLINFKRALLKLFGGLDAAGKKNFDLRAYLKEREKK